jgi:hypothetical protein
VVRHQTPARFFLILRFHNSCVSIVMSERKQLCQ